MADTGPVIRYAVYDKLTGKILHTHGRYSVTENRYVELPLEDVKAQFARDDQILGKVSNRDAGNLDVLKLELAHPNEPLGAVMVDTVARKLVKRPSLTLSADKRELVSDGKDSTRIHISVVDENGAVVSGANGSVKVTTERGRLSDRAGVVRLANGRATTTLTAANETVARVRIAATSLDEPCVRGHVEVEFV